MKKLLLLTILTFFTFFPTVAYLQTTYSYVLSGNFSATPEGAPDLIQIPNNDGLTGEFVSRPVPETTCGVSGTALGYRFEDDSGLQFDNFDEFIGESYSIAFNFQIDEFITPPPWVRIMSFTHTDDVGIYIKLTDPPNHGTLEFWPYGTVGEVDFFSPEDFYQLILTRNDSGSITIYVNGSEFAQYNDATTRKYLPQPPDNYIIWFRDHPSVLADEASPGFVSDIVLTNVAWPQQTVSAKWDEFCSDLLDVGKITAPSIKVYPNPFTNEITIAKNDKSVIYISLYDLLGKPILNRTLVEGSTRIATESLAPGIYLLKEETENGIYTTTLVKSGFSK